MKKLLFVSFLLLIWGLGINVFEAKAQTAYGISIVRYNNSTRIVDGYSGTWLDYYAGLYYDPEVRGDLYRTDNPEISLDSGYSTGWADIIPAEVYLDTTNYQEGRTYCTYSQHFVLAYYYYTTTNYWLDPFRYSSFIYTGGGPWGGYPFSYYYVYPRRYRLGWTQACITIPVTPPPTPTPTPPTPTPTPTPCDPNLGGFCQGENMDLRVSPLTIKPSGVTGGTNKAKVTVRITNYLGSPVANRNVSLSLVLRPLQSDFGGHIVSQHTGNKPLGKLENISGTTNSNGVFETHYSPSHISGTIGIDGISSRSRDTTDILVGNTSLVLLGEGENYHLIGQTTAHPVNHYATQQAVAAHTLIANDYKAQFYGNNPIPENDKLAYNDMSLVWGGKFDLAKKWSASGAHAEHREGINTDVRCCTNPGNVPRNRWVALNEIFRNRGSNRTNDETGGNAPHWHLRFENFLAQEDLSQTQNKIEQNPNVFGEYNPAPVTTHYFVELVWWTILDRESTQEEWSNWHTQIVGAKAQGASQLFEKAKAFQQELFSSSEYVARHRTNEEFVEDVFNSHLMREPTQAEKEYWISYMQNLPPSFPQQRRRLRMLAEFELLDEFEDVVSGIVDETIAPEPSPTP